MAVTDDDRDAGSTDARPDLNSVEAGDWPQRAFPLAADRRPDGVPVVIRQSVLNAVHRHGRSTTDVELCGFLVGGGYRDEQGPFVHVEASIRGVTSGQAAQVTFTAETWDHAQRLMDREHPDKRIIGWYHTHPGFGIFLSDMDLFIHRNFFGSDEQLALVYDPVAEEDGVFLWRSGEARLDDAMLIEEDVSPLPQMTAAAGRPESAVGEKGLNELFARMERLEHQMRWASYSMIALAVLAVIWPVSFWNLMDGPAVRDHVFWLSEREADRIRAAEEEESQAERDGDAEDGARPDGPRRNE